MDNSEKIYTSDYLNNILQGINLPKTWGKNDHAAIDSIVRCLIDNDRREFIICPFGQQGLLAKQIINLKYGLEEKLIVDNVLSKYNPTIINTSNLVNYQIENSVILIVTKNHQDEIIESLLEGGASRSQIVNVFDNEQIPDQYRQPFKIGQYSHGGLLEIPLAGMYIESVGSFCSFAAGTAVVGNHLMTAVTTKQFLDVKKNSIPNSYHFMDEVKIHPWDYIKKATIGNDVWLGRNVIITNGVKIGNGVIAGAGAVITKDVPDYAVVVGVPARIIKYRFTPKQIEQLNEIKWWDWDLEKIKECYDDFFDIETFIKKHYKRV